MKAKHLVPSAFTLANIGFGFFSMLSAAQGQYSRAVFLLFGAALCDLFDGKMARWLDASTKFGMELDSLSDAISFGLAPALLVYLSTLSQLGPEHDKIGLGGACICLAYALTAVVRLARYNVDDGKLGGVTFEGMPTPIAAGYMLSYVLVRDSLSLPIIAGGTLLLAVLMVSKLKIPKFRPGGLPFPMLIIGIGTFIVFMVKPSALTWHVWNAWNFVLVIANYVQLSKKGYLSGAVVPEADAHA
ncbi:MAG: phosphatidylcholine/phosphatidylserine synthase [Polyangia bacterium]